MASATDASPPRQRDPIERLLRTHRRIEEELSRLQDALAGSDEQAAQGLDEALGFLRRNVRRHEIDEEQHLFPLARTLPGLDAALDALCEEHVAHESLIEKLVAFVDKPIAPHRAAVAQLAAQIERAYDAHIAAEESVVFPALRAGCSQEALDLLEVAMQAQRGGGGGGGGGGRRQGP
jgi:iron-sulfur cluster repair protein YtfE (RIC family)